MLKKTHLITLLVIFASIQLKAQTVGTVKADYLQTKSPEYKKFQELRETTFNKTYKDLLRKIDSVDLALSKTPDNNRTKKEKLTHAKYYYKDLLPQFENDQNVSLENKTDFGTAQQYYVAMDNVLSKLVTDLNIDCIFGSNSDLSNSFVIYSKPNLDITKTVEFYNSQTKNSKTSLPQSINVGFIDIKKFAYDVPHDESKDVYFLEKSYAISDPIKKLNNRILDLKTNAMINEEGDVSIDKLKAELKKQEQIAATKREALEKEKREYYSNRDAKIAIEKKAHYDKVKSSIKYVSELNNIDLVLNTADFRIINSKTKKNYPELTNRILLGLKEGGDITSMVKSKIKWNSAKLKVGMENAKIAKVDLDALANHLIANNADFINFLKKLENQYQGRAYQQASRHHIEKFQYQIYTSLQDEAIKLAKSKGYNTLLDLAFVPSTGMYGTNGMKWRMDYIYFHPRNELTMELFEKTKESNFVYKY
ncbi:hypothetical protein [uncultured Tenacibaculum sp.]|uniref:hypothetical protein n=1 Tax=uncultured Tenacibaculum sp. TaxID=174713 RepID=UPI002627F2ED|nr:hypothetical protein [uncultured Tenacibaculum sp.]